MNNSFRSEQPLRNVICTSLPAILRLAISFQVGDEWFLKFEAPSISGGFSGSNFASPVKFCRVFGKDEEVRVRVGKKKEILINKFWFFSHFPVPLNCSLCGLQTILQQVKLRVKAHIFFFPF